MPVLWLLPGQWIGWQSRLLREFTEGNLVIDGAGKLGGDKGGLKHDWQFDIGTNFGSHVLRSRRCHCRAVKEDF